MVKGIQELILRVKALEKENEALKLRVAKLEQDMKAVDDIKQYIQEQKDRSDII